MNYTFNETHDRRKLSAALAVFSALAAVLTALFGEIVLSAFSALYAMLVLVDATKNRILSLAIGAGAIALSLALYFFDVMALALPFGVLIGFIIAWLFSRGASKSEIAVYVILLVLLLLVITVYLMLAMGAGELGFSAVAEYASAEYAKLREEFAAEMMVALEEVSPELYEVLDASVFTAALDEAFSLSLAVLGVIAFAIAGFTLKIFSFLLFRFAAEPKRVLFWRFTTSNVFAYFYVALLLLGFFVGNEGVLAITVNNFYCVFLFVYAYIGYNFVLSLMSQRLGFGAASFLVIGCLIFLGVFAFQVLSAFGVIFTVRNNKVGVYKT